MNYRLLSPAKINLFLQVTGKRFDGYHELFTLISPVTLYDTITFIFEGEKIRVSCSDPDVPDDETNIAHKAANIFFNALNKREGLKIDIEKKIPAGAGLGGGSSNAATVLLCLNRYYNYPFSSDKLMEMGLSLGADVPFFIFGKPATASGIGEKLEYYKRLKPFLVLLVYPGFSVSTADVYKNFNFGLTKCNKKFKYNFSEDQDFDVQYHLCNDLESVTVSKYPEIAEIKEMLLINGAEGSMMSGSGSTVFGLFSDKDKIEKAYLLFSQHQGWKVYIADLLQETKF